MIEAFSPRRLGSAALTVCGLLCAANAAATPRALPFTYTSETLPKGAFEIEQFADLTPVRAYSTASGEPVWYGATQFQTELEYGLAERLELGLYFAFAPSPGDGYASTASLTEGNGFKQRLRYALANPGEWPIDVGLYGELVENDREIELEAKVILQRRLGKLRIAANLWAEYEVYYRPQKDLVFNPTLGITYEVTPAIHLGAETWLRVELPDPAPHPRPFSVGPVDYLGPTFLFNFGRLWWSNGIYVRTTRMHHTMKPGEPYGPVWGRTMIGFDL